MEDRMKEQFVKRGLFWIITRLILVASVAGITYYAVTEQQESMVWTIQFFVVYTMAMLLVPSFLIEKTAAKIKQTDFNVDWRVLDGNCCLMIDTQKGKIASVWATRPFKIQIIDAAQLTDAKTFSGNRWQVKTTNRIGVTYWIGKKRYLIYTYLGGKRRYVVLNSKLGQECIQNARITYSKLIMAMDVAVRHGAVLRSERVLANLLTDVQISQVNSLLLKGRKVEAIKIIQFSTNIGLAHAKEIVDQWELYYQGGFYRR